MENNVMYTDGAVNISDDVLQTIAAMAVSEVNGVSLAVSLTEGFVEKLVKKTQNKAVRVEVTEKTVTLELHVFVAYGSKIQEVAAKLQDAVKHNVETMTDLTVTRVDICVDGIIKETKKAEPAPLQD